MKRYLNILFLISLTIISRRIDETPINNDVSDYPTTISRLSEAELSEAIMQYANLNGSQICTSLNVYGYPEYDLGLCLNRPILREKINKDELELLNIAKETIFKNKKYTGIGDITKLSVLRSTGINGCIKCDGSDGDIRPIKWRFDYNNQEYQGLEVFNTQIIVILDNNGVFMLGGNWYRNIVIPTANLYSLEQVKEDLIGQKRTIFCWTKYEITVTAENFPEEALKHLPLIMAGGKPPRYSVTYGGIDAFNARMTEQKRNLSLDEVLRQRDETHQRLIEFIQTVLEDQIARETRFLSCLRLDTYGHYPKHAEAIRKWREQMSAG